MIDFIKFLFCVKEMYVFRKNNEHKLNFSHPGDSDYDTDPDDNRPSCSYGSACYRRNSIHRRDFKHPSNGGKVQPAAFRSNIKCHNIYSCMCYLHKIQTRYIDSGSD